MNSAERTALLDQQKRQRDYSYRVWVREEWHVFPVWDVPVEALALNIDNRRFGAERKLMEEKIGRSLDPENRAEDERSVISILLDAQIGVLNGEVVGKMSKDARALEEDWRKRKQETPFWIRPDGTVSNGNRRLAMVKRLQEEVGDDSLRRVDAVILDAADVPEQDLFEMEQHEQLTQNQKLLYTDINRLLTIREAAIARGIDWGSAESVMHVAGQIQHLTRGNRSDAAVQLRAIRYMDAFLIDSDAPGMYEKAYGSVETFRDIGRNMAMLDDDMREYADEMLRVCFASLRANQSFQSIRGLRQLFKKDRTAFDRLVNRVDSEETEWREAGGGGLGEPDLSGYGEAASDDDDIDEEDETEPVSVVPNYPKPAVRSLISNAIDAMRSRDLDVLDAVQQALSRLNSVPPTADVLGNAFSEAGGEEIRAITKGIVSWAEQARQIVES
jgi:hypothetical protein